MKPDSIIPEAPGNLSETALKEWNRITKIFKKMGAITEIDMAALAAYCDAFGRWYEATDKLKKTGIIIKTKSGNIIQNPLIGIANRALDVMHKYLVEFGMTPSSRSRVKVPQKPEGEKNKWSNLG
jgi:P27 family predicted phage terminase small subunit